MHDGIDLHVHTTASDGSLSPAEVVEAALEKGLTAISVTDHDTVEGVPYAVKAASGYPLKVIPGVEISASYHGKEIHVLGYNIDVSNDLLNETLKEVARLRDERIGKMCALLREHGVDITIEELHEASESHLLTRGNIGHFLINNGYAKDMQEAFEKYIGTRSSCYIPRFKLDVEDTVKIIKYAKGICSLAHPVQYRLTDRQYAELFKDLKALGFSCIEAIHSDNKPGDDIRFKNLAASAGLLITGGSDFHGRSKPDISIGTGRGNIMVPSSILDNIGAL